MKKTFETRVIAEIAIYAAIAFVLDFLQGTIFNLTPLFVNGGSIGIAMLPIIVIACRRGIIAGSICGLVTGILQMLGGISTIPVSNAWYHLFFQILLDYALPYCFCGFFTGLVMKFLKQTDNKNQVIVFLVIASLFGGLGKLLCHFLSGCIYWQNFDMGAPWIYSLAYNSSYVLPSTIISMILIVLIYLKQPKLVVRGEL